MCYEAWEDPKAVDIGKEELETEPIIKSLFLPGKSYWHAYLPNFQKPVYLCSSKRATIGVRECIEDN